MSSLKDFLSGITIEAKVIEFIMKKLDSIESEIIELRKIHTGEVKIDTFLDAKQVCEILKISSPTRIKLVKSGVLKCKRVGRRLLFSKNDVDEAILNYGKWERDKNGNPKI